MTTFRNLLMLKCFYVTWVGDVKGHVFRLFFMNVGTRNLLLLS